MSLEFDIARRLSRRECDGESRRSGVMERVAVVATAVSVAVMIVTMSVVVGFKHDLRRVMTGAASSLSVTSPQSGGVMSGIPVERGEPLESVLHSVGGVERISPFTSKEGVIKSDDNTAGVVLKGVDSLYDMSFVSESLRRGSLPRVGREPRTKDIAVSQSIADRMEVDVDDRVEMVFITDGEVRRDRFRISGIYSTGVEMIDATMVITDMRNVQRLCDWPAESVTGYEVWLGDGVDALAAAGELNGRLVELYLEEGVDAEAFAVEQIYPNIFGWLATHDVNAAVMVTIMIVVALLNMITVLLIIVLERSRMIGELKALGMSDMSLTGIFFFRALFIAVRGMAWGAAAGLALCVVQYVSGILTLPSDGYFLSQVTVDFCWGVWGLTLACALAVIMCVMLLPAAFVRRISPSQTMRYE
ncbi:MAG: ABC transporter permease [Alistipes sp.]|nr:ABC transporter permease [Alistipes sp.]